VLRAIRVTGPVVAALMVVVLLFEPPALRPSDRIPTLHVFRSRPASALDRDAIEAAIAEGRRGQPTAYLLRRVLPGGGSATGEAAGTVYTPSLRVAWAAHAAQRAGWVLEPEDVPTWMTAPLLYVALRAPLEPGDELPRLAVVPTDATISCRVAHPTVVRPLWRSAAGAITRFGAPPPFPDLGLVAAFPLEVVDEDVDFVAYRCVETAEGMTAVEMRGRATQAERARQPRTKGDSP